MGGRAVPVGILRFIVMRAWVYRALLAAAFVTAVLAAQCTRMKR
ncbi:MULTISPECIES: hypothetical protein [Streptomyces]|nr:MULTISPECIES: hypothetical protein [Streptomyces]